ncbi:MAG: pentapeptide repeat-containing protein [Cyanobacteria bacterium MAG CAR4_bin_6]|nr:pentapeptide repeat-containing protein [Cyanobacteria bacterium MAG CAR4_bin_6]
MRQSGREIRENLLVILGVSWLVLIAVVPITSWPWLPDQLRKTESDHLREWGWYFLGVGIAPLTLLLTHNRTRSLKMQTDALRVQTDTDVFTKSIKLLGDKQAAVRQGGIYSLGGIAKNNCNLHPTIMRIMTSYIQEKTYDKFNKQSQKEAIQKPSNERISLDVKAAIDVLKYRQINHDQPLKDGKRPSQFDLSNSCVFDGDFSFIELSHTNFSDSVMHGCCFDRANLSSSSFVASDFHKSTLIKTILKNCEFKYAKFQECNFNKCDLSSSEFKGYDLDESEKLTQQQIDEKRDEKGSDFQGASFIKATLKNCEFKNTNFHECDFEKCNLSGSKFENCDLTDARNLTPKQINSVREIDESTYKKLPDHLKESAIPKIQNEP